MQQLLHTSRDRILLFIIYTTNSIIPSESVILLVSQNRCNETGINVVVVVLVLVME